MSSIKILLLCMLIAWTIGGVGAIFFPKSLKIGEKFPYITSLLGSVFAIVASVIIFINESIITIHLWSVTSFFQLSFSLQLLSALFLVIISILALVVSIYTPQYIQRYEKSRSLNYIGGLLNLFLISLVGVIMADNILTFLLLWEMMSLLSFFLVIVEHEDANVLQSGRLYVIMTHFGTGFIILAFLLMYVHTSSLNFTEITQLQHLIPHSQKSLIFIFVLIGFGMKAGLVPLHIWLPRAHPVAPSHISTLMSAVMIKTAVYSFIRIIYDLIGVQAKWWGVVVLMIGMITAIYGILYSVAQKDIKRLLAYSSVENMGLIFMALGASLLFTSIEQPLLASLALLAALYHSLNHAFFKGLLFMGAGSVYYATGSKNMDELGGLIRYLPYTAGLFLLGVLAIASFPPFNGFISKWLTFQSMIQLAFVNQGQISLTLVGAVAATTLLFVGGIVLLGMVKLFGIVFLAKPRSMKVTEAKEVPLSMRIAMGMLGVGIIALGIFPGFFAKQMSKVTHLYFSDVVYSKPLLFSLNAVSTKEVAIIPAIILLLSLGIGGLLLFAVWRMFGKSKYDLVEPWACGVRITPNMTYSGTSFSHPFLLIYEKIFGQTMQTIYQKQRIHLLIVLRKFFDIYFYQPLIQTVVYLSKQIRRIQDGRIHSYLAYIFVSLIVLLLIASF